MKIPQWVFEEDLKWAKLKLALIKENFAYRKFFKEFLIWERQTEPRFGPVPNFNDYGLVGFNPFPGYPEYPIFRNLCDPIKDINGFPEKVIESILPRLFYQNAVSCVQVKNQPTSIVFEGHCLTPIENVLAEGLNPYERIYKIDLRKKKSQILKEIERYLDGAYSKKEQSETFNEKDRSYYSWIAEKQRYRTEAWKHLEVWTLRKKRESFTAIAAGLDISVDVAKKSFARAYELTQRRQYDPDLYRREAWTLKRNELARTCETCPDRDTCTELCPGMLAFVDQDQTRQREKTFDNPDYVDMLDFGNTL